LPINATYTTKTISSNNNNNAALTTISSSSLLLFSHLQQIELIQNKSDNYGTDHYAAFTYRDKDNSQMLKYTKTLRLTGSNQSHQVKVVVNYSITDPLAVSQNMNAIMQLFTSNGTLMRNSSFSNSFIINSALGQTLLATTITDNTVRNVKAVALFFNATKNANSLSININFVQKIPVIIRYYPFGQATALNNVMCELLPWEMYIMGFYF
jgi:hypothetical protein